MLLNKNNIKIMGISAVACAIVLEGYVRFSGMVDFPVYQKDDRIGYYLQPNQHGRFLNKNEWMVNEESFLSPSFKPGIKKDVLLVGDSIVMGGNLIAHSDRLGARLQDYNRNAWNVWSAGAGGWSVMNEIAFLKAHEKAVGEMRWLVWVINSQDFIGLVSWESNRSHPLRRPIFASWFLFDKFVWAKYVEPKLNFSRSAPDPRLSFMPTDFTFDSFDEYLQKLKSEHPRIKVAIVWYPDRAEEGEMLPFWENLTVRVKEYTEKHGIKLINIRDDARWNVECYQDQIHPRVEANSVLAQIIGEKLLQ